jgi:hypothetical protein
MGLTIAEMRLSANAWAAAHIVLTEHPSVIFTSGRRDARDQARAMATNTIRYGVAWLGQTYKNQDMVRNLEEWMETHLDQTASEKLMTEGFYQTLLATQPGQLAQFPHCRGDAFDIQCPRFASGQVDETQTNAIRRTIENVPIELGLQLILTREGAHRVIHAQFNHAIEPVEV